MSRKRQVNDKADGRDSERGSCRINLTTITVGGKKQSQLAASLNTQRYPDATVTLTQPVPWPRRSSRARP